MTRNLELRVYRTAAELDALRPAWDELLDASPAGSTFCTWEWQTSWWKSFHDGQEFLLLAFFDSDLLIGLAPFWISHERVGLFRLRVLRLMGDGTGDSDSLDLPVRQGYEDRFADGVLRYLREHRQECDAICLDAIAPGSTAVKAILNAFTSKKWISFVHATRSSYVSLPDSWEGYLKTLASEDRKNLERYTRRLQKLYSVRIYRCTREDELPRTLEALFRLHQDRWQGAGQPGSFSSPERRRFYYTVSAALLNRGWLELWVLELNDEISAVQFAFRYKERVFQLQEGYDRSRASDRPGFVLRGTVLRELIARGVKVYDFLGGSDSYKRRWGAHTDNYKQVHFAPRFSVGGIALGLVELTSTLKEKLRAILPVRIWSVLRRINRLLLNSHVRQNKVENFTTTISSQEEKSVA